MPPSMRSRPSPVSASDDIHGKTQQDKRIERDEHREEEESRKTQEERGREGGVVVTAGSRATHAFCGSLISLVSFAQVRVVFLRLLSN